ncbi:hypothetical protein [Paenibacillus silviterrae]|uniref:hypothetical protein n=1 Tax=Paenibacillus silviterrae TaxID=3242194 RepID=UPI002542E956|nr:hypothetical protein [Paenibacillus chinjuensis]
MSGTLHKADITVVDASDLPKMNWTRGLSWLKENRAKGRDVYKITDAVFGTIHGAFSISDAGDHMYINLLEVAPSNRNKANLRNYCNVSKIIIGAAGAISIQKGYDGYLALTPKSDLYDYYANKFKAYALPDRKMGIAGVVPKTLD